MIVFILNVSRNTNKIFNFNENKMILIKLKNKIPVPYIYALVYKLLIQSVVLFNIDISLGIIII